MLKFVDIKTFHKDSNGCKEARGVSLSYSDNNDEVYLLGNLLHNTQIIIDQKLVDDLQKIVNSQEK